MIVYPWIAEYDSIEFNVKSVIAYNALIGFAIGAVSVTGHQLVKQFKGRNDPLVKGDDKSPTV